MAILVTGVTGLVGRLLVEELVGRGVSVRATTRRPEAAGLPRGFATGLMDRYARHEDTPEHPANDVVATVLGRRARTYAEWVAANAADFRGEGE
jgi:uncharacterized protein YbjT (DUF2867 family)